MLLQSWLLSLILQQALPCSTKYLCQLPLLDCHLVSVLLADIDSNKRYLTVRTTKEAFSDHLWKVSTHRSTGCTVIMFLDASKSAPQLATTQFCVMSSAMLSLKASHP